MYMNIYMYRNRLGKCLQGEVFEKLLLSHNLFYKKNSKITN